MKWSASQNLIFIEIISHRCIVFFVAPPQIPSPIRSPKEKANMQASVVYSGTLNSIQLWVSPNVFELTIYFFPGALNPPTDRVLYDTQWFSIGGSYHWAAELKTVWICWVDLDIVQYLGNGEIESPSLPWISYIRPQIS